MNDKQHYYTGTLIVKLPDDDRDGMDFQNGISIEIKSNTLSSAQLLEKFQDTVLCAVKNIDKSKLDPDVLKPTCNGGYCDRPVIRFQLTTEHNIFLNNFSTSAIQSVVVKPMTSFCRDYSTSNKYCQFRDKETRGKDYCKYCTNPYMKKILDIAEVIRISQR